MFRFLLQPKWIALTLLAILLQPAFWELSQWQMRRLHDRQASNFEITHNEQAPAIALEKILDSKSNQASADPNAQWRSVAVTGVWLPQKQVLVRKKSYESNLGFWALTPMRTESGQVVFINRGWVAASGSALESPKVSAPPTGPVQVLGRLRMVRDRVTAKPEDLPIGQVDDVQPLEVIPGKQVLSNGYLELTASLPESRGSDLQPILPPEISEGPHKSYAIQWVIFAILTLVGWGILVRKELQELNNSGAN